MKKALQANGNSWQLYINKPLADILGITSDNYVISLVVREKVIHIQLHNDAEEVSSGMLTKKLIRRGSGYGLNISKPLLEVLEIDPENDVINIDIYENKLVIKKG